jgi:hypothetical protein
MMRMLGNQKRHSESRNGDDKEWKKEDEKNIDWKSSVHGGALHLTPELSRAAKLRRLE